MAVLGNGRSCSPWNTSQPRRTNSSASCGDLKRVNSSTSAPAMKPSFAERMTRPFGFSARSAPSARRSSSSASREKVFAASPCLSKVSQASPSRSVSQRQCLVSVPRSMIPPLQRFDHHRAAEAAADADAGDAALRVFSLQGFQQVQHDARPRGAHRMAERDRAAVDVQLALVERAERAVEAELVAAELLVLP